MNIDKMSGRKQYKHFGMICDNWKWGIAYYCFISEVFLSCFAFTICWHGAAHSSMFVDTVCLLSLKLWLGERQAGMYVALCDSLGLHMWF